VINDGINDVPDKTIAIFYDDDVETNFDKKYINEIIEKPSKKRDWFPSHFYKCLPLSIGNQYGFVVKSQYDIDFLWNGGEKIEDTVFYFNEGEQDKNNYKYPRIRSWFGSGIITIGLPLTLRTPPNINLMTINPPNYVLPNITVMSGVVESDNLRRDFTINLKIQIPNIRVKILAGTPLAGIIPIPRYFADDFNLVDAENIFSQDIFIEEYQAKNDSYAKRTEIEYKSKNRVGRDYLLGKDVYGNKFKDHQTP
jgi:hypothetical protein